MYTCPMHPEISQEKPGHCPKCGMSLTLSSRTEIRDPAFRHSGKLQAHPESLSESNNSYKPLIIIIFLILLTSLTLSAKDILLDTFSLQKFMHYFMAGFFLVFSGFKLLDTTGFAQGYSTYDLLAKRVFAYGYVYPFLELLLGLFYITGFTPPLVNLFTFILMGFSGIGVLIKILKHEKFQCACLGTFLKVPLTKVTLVEDFGMALMALLILIIK